MRKYFLTGLLVLVPLVITAWVLSMIISTLDQSLLFVPEAWQPRNMFGMDVPGFGAVLTLAIVFLTGLLTNNLVGGYIVRLGDRVMKRIPVVSSLYGSVKQVSDNWRGVESPDPAKPQLASSKTVFEMVDVESVRPLSFFTGERS